MSLAATPPEFAGIRQEPGLHLDVLDEGAIWSVRLATPKTNILDSAKIRGLTGIFRAACEASELRAVLLAGEGENFSTGASVEEHLPGSCHAMIRDFHGLFRALLAAPVFTLAAVRGHCLGGALELASFCSRLVTAPDARLGLPEIHLGVFPPVAAVALPHRVGRHLTEDLCATGRILQPAEAMRIGLIDEIHDDPEEAALAWARQHLVPRSGSSLRHAVRASRIGFAGSFLMDLEQSEHLYLEELMGTHDAVEGLEAFREKREPVWRNG